MIGAQAAEEAAEAIATLCTEPVLLVAGLGGGHRHGCRSRRGQDRHSARLRGHRRGDVAVSSFESRRRVQQARRGLTALQAYVPRIVVVKLRELMPLPPATRIRDVYEMADHKAASAVMDTLRGHGRMAMECNASGGSLGPITITFWRLCPLLYRPACRPCRGQPFQGVDIL